MPLPLGHSAIGFAIHSLMPGERGSIQKWKMGIMIVALSNLPDIDVLVGLVLHNNGSIYHRGPTHSILFALVLGFLTHKATRRWTFLPAIHFITGFFLILSHSIADFLLTDAPVSFFWPFKVSWAPGDAGWGQIFHAVFFEAGNDIVILLVCAFIVIMGALLRRTMSLEKIKIT